MQVCQRYLRWQQVSDPDFYVEKRGQGHAKVVVAIGLTQQGASFRDRSLRPTVRVSAPTSCHLSHRGIC